MSVDPPVVAVVIVDHGSRRAEANRRHEEFVREWRSRSSATIVEPAHMELAEPSVGTAVDACVAAGAGLVVVAPYFLWPGNHWEHDIPRLAAEACARHPGVRHLVTAPLGPHPLLGEIVADRVEHCLAHARAGGPGCEVCDGSGGCRLQ
jgi:sirohydrochlorin ferrochelatase